ncbi:MAG: tagaturonate reductase [Cytophagaceae bacterium]|nr:tagaturonate reductase [Cytophagaceae bacterium]
MPQLPLSRKNMGKNTPHVPLLLPRPAIFDLPERVIQFGTGVLLRGLCDYFIDEANRQGLFNGRIVVVKSTDQGDAAAFEAQNGLFTHVIRGLVNDQPVEEYRVNAAISRTLSARSQWADVLACAHNPELQIVISNTTEVGIQLVEDESLTAQPPVSFPGKLTCFLYERWKAFGGSEASGLVIVPTELIPDNGIRLQEICLELAYRGGLDVAFIDWLETANRFCNSLVDRIVPGKPNPTELAAYEQQLGYRDNLLCVSEVYRLWAIEAPADASGERVKAILSFAQADEGVLLAPDIEIYRELKLRLLNGTHTLTCALNYLSGCDTVRQSMKRALNAGFAERLMLDELAPSIPYAVDASTAEAFGRQVLERFRNPFLEHKLLSITTNYTTKLRMRVVSLVQSYYARFTQTDPSDRPEDLSLGFAAYLLFMKAIHEENGRFSGERNGEPYAIQDEAAGWFADWWQRDGEVTEVLAHTDFWETDLSKLPGFSDCIQDYLTALQENGVNAVLEQRLSAMAEKVVVQSYTKFE